MTDIVNDIVNDSGVGPPNDAAPLLQVRALRVAYRVPGRNSRGTRLDAVRGVSFDLAPGHILAIVGESGCGKTSLARALLGLVSAASGSLRFRGRELVGLAPRERRSVQREIQHVFQDPASSLSPRRTVGQSLAEPLALYRIGRPDERQARIEAALSDVDLDPALQHRLPHELSGGQRQRVALARACIAGPALIVADEPTSALDVSTRTRVVELFHRLRDERGIAFVLISHDLAVVERLADEVAVMYVGGFVEHGPAEALYRAPAHPYTQALLAAAAGRDRHDDRQNDRARFAGEAPSPLTPPPGCVFHTRCPRVMARCATEPPAETEVRAGADRAAAHRVRCHLCS